jgi:nucleoside-diphosphate-sugar epimerase
VAVVEKPISGRIISERYAIVQHKKGIRVSTIRLAPYVYGRGGSGVRLFMTMAANGGEVVYVGDGQTRTTTVHVDDAARLYFLAAKNAKASEAYNATYETDVTDRQLAEVMGQVMGLPVRSQSYEDTVAKAGELLAKFLSTENRASNAKAIKELGWQPREKGILEEITAGSYVELAKTLRKPAA